MSYVAAAVNPVPTAIDRALSVCPAQARFFGGQEKNGRGGAKGQEGKRAKRDPALHPNFAF
jgi:hypothetical protein